MSPDIQDLMREDPQPPIPEPTSPTPESEDDVLPWEILEKHSLEEDGVWVGIVPVLSRGASLNRKDVAECLHHARLFEKTRTAGVPIGGQECSRCAEDGGYCIVPAEHAHLERFVGVTAIGRCTNCILSGGNNEPESENEDDEYQPDDRKVHCDLLERTTFVPCFCEWWLPTEDRVRVKLWRDMHLATRYQLGLPRGRRAAEVLMPALRWVFSEEHWMMSRYLAAIPFPRLGAVLDNPRALHNLMKSFVTSLPAGTWARPSKELVLVGPCDCQNIPTTSSPRWWLAVQALATATAQEQSHLPTSAIKAKMSVASVLPWAEPAPEPTSPTASPTEREEQGALANVEPPKPATSPRSSISKVSPKPNSTASLDDTAGLPTLGTDPVVISSSELDLAEYRSAYESRQPEEMPRRKSGGEEEWPDSFMRTKLTIDADEIATAAMSRPIEPPLVEQGSQPNKTFSLEEGPSEDAAGLEGRPEERSLPRKPTEEFWGIDGPTECRGARVIGILL